MKYWVAVDPAKALSIDERGGVTWVTRIPFTRDHAVEIIVNDFGLTALLAGVDKATVVSAIEEVFGEAAARGDRVHPPRFWVVEMELPEYLRIWAGGEAFSSTGPRS